MGYLSVERQWIALISDNLEKVPSIHRRTYVESKLINIKDFNVEKLLIQHQRDSWPKLIHDAIIAGGIKTLTTCIFANTVYSHGIDLNPD